MFVSLLLFVIGCVDGAWYGTVNSDGSETIVDDSESLHDVMVQQLLNMSFSMDEIQYLYPKPDAEEASSSLGLYSSHLDGRKKRSLYTNMNEAQVHLITNQERMKTGAAPLYANLKLITVSRAHSEDMLKRGFFDHVNPNGQSPFARMSAIGYRYTTAAENIAYGQSSPMQVMGSWMTSPGHKANILNPALKELGVGLSSSGFRWTQGFGAPQSGCGNGFKEGSESCDTGEAKEANCVNCRLAAGATCSPRTELDGGDQCGSDRVTEQITVPTQPPPTPKPTAKPTSAPATQPGETTAKATAAPNTPAPTTTAELVGSTRAGTIDDLVCAYAVGKGCDACVKVNNGGVCKWCPLPGKKACMAFGDSCGGSGGRSSLRTPTDCLMAIDSINAKTTRHCEDNMALGCGGCVASDVPGGCKWCPATVSCLAANATCIGSLDTVDVCAEMNQKDELSANNLENLTIPGPEAVGPATPAAGMPIWLIAVIAALGVIVFTLVVVVAVMALLAQKEKKSAEELRKWAEETGAQPAKAAPSSPTAPGATIVGITPLAPRAPSDTVTTAGAFGLMHPPPGQFPPIPGGTIKKPLPTPGASASGVFKPQPLYGDTPPLDSIQQQQQQYYDAMLQIGQTQPVASTTSAFGGGDNMSQRLPAMMPPSFRGDPPPVPTAILTRAMPPPPTHIDLTLRVGDRIKLLDTSLSWFKGEIDGRVGSFPSNYVKLD